MKTIHSDNPNEVRMYIYPPDINSRIGLKISGTREEPILTAECFVAYGRLVYGVAKLTTVSIDSGLLFEAAGVYVACMNDIPKIKVVIAHLPTKQVGEQR